MALDEGGAIAGIVILTLAAVALIITIAVLQTRPATVCENCGASSGVVIGIVNQSSATSTQVASFVNAIQLQVSNDLFKAWGISASLTIYSSLSAVPSKTWYILLQDTTDLPGSLGYHTVDSNGIPFAKVFVVTATQAGVSWSITLSHETLEMLCDPYTFTAVFKQNSASTGTIIVQEICDSVESDTYNINGVPVSDFVFPAYWVTFLSGPFDQMGLLTQPFQLRSGGFATIFTVNSGSGYNQVNGPGVIPMHSGENKESSDFVPKDGSMRLFMERMNKGTIV